MVDYNESLNLFLVKYNEYLTSKVDFQTRKTHVTNLFNKLDHKSSVYPMFNVKINYKGKTLYKSVVNLDKAPVKDQLNVTFKYKNNYGEAETTPMDLLRDDIPDLYSLFTMTQDEFMLCYKNVFQEKKRIQTSYAFDLYGGGNFEVDFAIISENDEYIVSENGDFLVYDL